MDVYSIVWTESGAEHTEGTFQDGEVAATAADEGDPRPVGCRARSASGLDLKQFFDQWVETPFRPVSTRHVPKRARRLVGDGHRDADAGPHGGASGVRARRDVPFYVFPLTLRLLFNDGTTSDVSVGVDAATRTFVLPNPGRKPVVSITLDPGQDLLKIVESTGPA